MCVGRTYIIDSVQAEAYDAEAVRLLFEREDEAWFISIKTTGTILYLM